MFPCFETLLFFFQSAHFDQQQGRREQIVITNGSGHGASGAFAVRPKTTV